MYVQVLELLFFKIKTYENKTSWARPPWARYKWAQSTLPVT